jgi:pimeloyl-ACP methyl ester carboxylesterase
VVLIVMAGWMVIQIRANLVGRGRWLLVPLIAIIAVAGIGGSAATVGTAVASGTPGAGRMVDVGGRGIYIECIGTGGPAVILEAGLGEASPAWSRIAPAVAGSTTVCAYDRAGHGRSDEAGPQDGHAIAADLLALLDRAGVAGPYILVGHSSGGPYVRAFAGRYPEAVAGMVLLDAQPADAFSALPSYPAFYKGYRMAATLAPTLARVGVLAPILGLSADQSTPSAGRAFRDEVATLPVALDQAAALTSIGDKPLVVVSAGTGQQDGWVEAQLKLLTLSASSVQRLLPGATHTSVITGDDAATSAQAILDVLAAVRSGTALR